MPEIEVVRHVIRPQKPHGSEEYDPAGDVLIVVHKNPEDPDDPTEFGHHIPLQGLAYRKEMWGSSEYADVIDQELKDLERFYFWDPKIHAGVHPLAAITEHYYEAPREQMKSFTPDYILDAQTTTVMAVTEEARGRRHREVVLEGLVDVKECLSSRKKKSFPCKGMTGLSAISAAERSKVNNRMGAQTERITLHPCKALDDVRQYLTDRSSELDVRQ